MVESMPIQLSLKIPCYRASPDMVNKNVANRQAGQVNTHLHKTVRSPLLRDRTVSACWGVPQSPSSSQAPYPSLPAKAESSLIPLLLLSPCNPLRWACTGPPFAPPAQLRDFCEIAFRTAYRCSEGRSFWMVCAETSIPKMRLMLALAVSSSFQSSRVWR